MAFTGKTVTAICDSGGIAVLAHPLEYKMTATRLRALTDAFCEAGGKAIEVINGRPRPDDQALLWRIADRGICSSLWVQTPSRLCLWCPFGS